MSPDGKLILCLIFFNSEPSYFESLGSIAESDNWRINSSNISKILRFVIVVCVDLSHIGSRKLDEYFKEVLQKGIDTSSVDVNAIGKWARIFSVNLFVYVS